ncbi:MAG TPA: DinB family protein [Ktedonosporobacter sp.]|nr:DinB family protein [Ktedonosporobacter sp.]
MELLPFFQEQLQISAAGFVWAAEQVPVEHHSITPPRPGWLGEWSLARHVFHMLYYEQYLALAQVQECANLAITYVRDEDQDTVWQREKRDIPSMLAEFQRTRSKLITLLASFDKEAWELPREETPWGETLTLRWYMTKAYQHTCEHTHAVLNLSLFWGCAAYRDQQEQQ